MGVFCKNNLGRFFYIINGINSFSTFDKLMAVTAVVCRYDDKYTLEAEYYQGSRTGQMKVRHALRAF